MCLGSTSSGAGDGRICAERKARLGAEHGADRRRRSRPCKSDVEDTAQSYDYYRKIGFFEKSAAVSAAALKSLVAVLQKTGEIKGDLPPEKLVMPGVTQLGP